MKALSAKSAEKIIKPLKRQIYQPFCLKKADLIELLNPCLALASKIDKFYLMYYFPDRQPPQIYGGPI